MTKTNKHLNNSKSIISNIKESFSKAIFVTNKISRFSVLIAFCLSVGIVISIGVTGLNAQVRQEISEDERFLLKSLRVVDSLAQRAERLNAEGDTEKAKFFGEYFQQNTSNSNSEITNLNQIARELIRDERAFAVEQNNLLNFRRLTREELEQLTPQERKALRQERRQRIRENRKALQALKARRTVYRRNYLNRINRTISPNTLIELRNFINSEVTIRNIERSDAPDGNLLASLNFLPTFFEPFSSLLGSGSSVQVWGLPIIYYDPSKQEITGVAETWGFCTEYESGGGGGGGGGGGPLLRGISNRLLEGTGYSVACDYIYAKAELFNPSNQQIGVKEEILQFAIDDVVEASVTKPVTVNGNYCVKGTHEASYNGINPNYQTQKCIEVGPEIASVEFKTFNQIGGPVDHHPAINGLNSSNAGKRIFTGKLNPGDLTNRAKVEVTATIIPATPGITVYFKSFDMDDPSANTAPVDDETVAKDNRGNVNGNKEGELSNGSGGCGNNCGITDSSGVATIDLEVTKHPGDNFAIVARKDSNDFSGVTVNGLDLQKNGSNITTAQTTSTKPLIRSELLTVWRKLHIEYDSMGSIGTTNREPGTVNGSVTLQPGGQATVNINTTSSFATERFRLGAMVVGNDYFFIGASAASTGTSPNFTTQLTIVNLTNTTKTISNNASVFLYDDDDFNQNDHTVTNGIFTTHSFDGDENESVVPITNQSNPVSFKYIQNSDNVNSNIYAKAYIKPNYDWASQSNLNQNNLPFVLNVAEGVNGINYVNTINQNRGSSNSENDDFWVVYLFMAYQGAANEDFDGYINNANESATAGVSAKVALAGRVMVCDCYVPTSQLPSTTCPATRVRCTVGATSQLPVGRDGSLVFMAVDQDLTTFVSTAPPSWRRTVDEISITPAHEIGHQFGLKGDVQRTMNNTSFHLLDYSNYPSNLVVNIDLHPEHINILRSRVRSPGQP